MKVRKILGMPKGGSVLVLRVAGLERRKKSNQTDQLAKFELTIERGIKFR